MYVNRVVLVSREDDLIEVAFRGVGSPTVVRETRGRQRNSARVNEKEQEEEEDNEVVVAGSGQERRFPAIEIVDPCV